MPADLDLWVSTNTPSSPRTASEVLAAALHQACIDAAENLRKSAPRQTGRLQAHFFADEINDGVVLRNTVRYAAYVREFAGAPPVGVLAIVGVREMAAKSLEEAGDEVALAVLAHVMAPLVKEARNV